MGKSRKNKQNRLWQQISRQRKDIKKVPQGAKGGNHDGESSRNC